MVQLGLLGPRYEILVLAGRALFAMGPTEPRMMHTGSRAVRAVDPVKPSAPVRAVPDCCRCHKKPAVRGTYPPLCAGCAGIRAREDAVDRRIAKQYNAAETAADLF